MKSKSYLFALLSACLALWPIQAATAAEPSAQARFIFFTNFTDFATLPSENGAAVQLLSPRIKAPLAWDELVISWNVHPGTRLKVEARAIYPDHETRFYQVALWSEEPASYPREGFKEERDQDGSVQTDTLVLKRPGADVQLRLLVEGPKKAGQMKFVGLSFCDTRTQLAPLPPNKDAWGKTLQVPERSQLSYPQQKGWCSPTSLSMVLGYWADRSHQSKLNLDVPEVADGVYDRVMKGTGNWPFNTAFAGKFKGMRAYVVRLSDVSELEDWVSYNIPVIISAPYHLLNPEATRESSGHLVTCVGFTEEGDVVINDPAANLKKGSRVRRVYKRENVIKAWAHNSNTAYIIYPETARIPKDRFGHWETR